MFHLIAENWLRFVLAFIIGLITAWWIWGRLTAAAETPARAAPTPAPTPVPAPTPAPAPAPAPTPAPAPAAEPGAPKIAAAVGEPDDLKLIKGIGPKLEKLCNSLGVTRFDQIAKWSAADIAEVDPHLENFTGRIERDDWVGQAKVLAAGGTTEFAERNS
jgi:predicted flap endonuclease-1-like 5' DNA nuclease